MYFMSGLTNTILVQMVLPVRGCTALDFTGMILDLLDNDKIFI